MKMGNDKYFNVSYRGEFSALIKVENKEDAIKKFENGKEDIECLGMCHPEFFEVEEADVDEKEEVSLAEAMNNGDKKKIKEIEERAMKGEVVRVM